jgi:acetyltransferase/esterase
VGRNSRDRFPSMPAAALARRLGIGTVGFPGGHVGYATHALVFTMQLLDVLA